MTLRPVDRIVRAEDTSDGAGVRLRRAVGTPRLDHLDPFLLFDEFRSDQPDDYIAGFPDHPHRGFETVTYMLAGRMEHADHAGNRGNLVAGSIQWMTAGRGIVHSEMPRQEDGLMWGFQLWINLPASMKMSPARYQDIAPERVPLLERDWGSVRVLAGEFEDVPGPVEGIVTSPSYLDIRLKAGARMRHPLGREHNAFVYAVEGTPLLDSPGGDGPVRVEAGHLAVLGAGDAIGFGAGPDEGAHLLLVAARPLGEPIARYGPFVMNTEDELRQAFEDLRRGTFLG
jgi:redox-sensitive bicupin YhaK (pirin superfamily)